MSTAELRRAAQRYKQNAYDARLATAERMKAFLGVHVGVGEWSRRVFEALSAWEKSLFDWEEIQRRHKEPSRLELAIWSDDNVLAGMALGLCTGQAVVLRFVEGDPREDCPLKGFRLLIALEAVTNYAQARGKKEIRVQPKNDQLVNLYEEVYGFTYHEPRGEEPYYRKGV